MLSKERASKEGKNEITLMMITVTELGLERLETGGNLFSKEAETACFWKSESQV